MRVCPACGEENADKAKFCSECATRLAEVEPPRETRKLVTVLFADMTGSTALGERLDPEALRTVIERYFDAMRAEIERHGGLVEKFIGDAVMAVFGIPQAHEDDALRAVRAAAGVHRVVHELNADLERDHGVVIAVRIGVNTGEAVTGDASDRQRLVTGDTVNVAARFEQAAPPGETLIGRETYRLVRDAIEVDDMDPLELKGKSQPITAFRLVEVLEGAAPIARRDDNVFVGRDRELRLLSEALERVEADRTSYLFTALGIAGVGKSRLVAEALARAGDRFGVMSGRCLPYGDGITFWPILEIVKSAARITDVDDIAVVRGKLRAAVGSSEDATTIATVLGRLLGIEASGGAIEETFWAVRRFFENLASSSPLVIVLDDVHWAAAPLLDLVETILDWSRDTPILLLCLARPEFLDERPGWGGGKMNTTTILLEPLDEQDASRLVTSLLQTTDFPDDLAALIVRKAEGNPLFVEELLAMLIDEGSLVREDGHWRQTDATAELVLPSSIRSLIAARLDQLEPSELRIVEGGAVVGQVFYRSALLELAPGSLTPDVGTYLRNLVRKDLLRPEPGGFPGDESYRFRHILIRDAAYRSMPKRTRAELHERFANWLERTAGERLPEFEEIVGHHLEQAAIFRTELGEDASEVAAKARSHLARAADRAGSRGDAPAAASLFSRALNLTDSPAERLPLLLGFAEVAQQAGLTDDARTAWDEIDTTNVDDDVLRALAAVQRLNAYILEEPEDWPAEVRRVAQEAIPVFERAERHDGLARTYMTIGSAAWSEFQVSTAAEAWERAAEHAGRAAQLERQHEALMWIATALLFGPTPLSEAEVRVQVELDRVGESPRAECWLLGILSSCVALRGDIGDARKLALAGVEMGRELGLAEDVAHFAYQSLAIVERCAGDREAELAVWLESLAAGRQIDQENHFIAAMAALLEAQMGNHNRAEDLLQLIEPTELRYNAHIRAVALQAEALVAVRDGDGDGSRTKAHEAIELFERGRFLTSAGDGLRVAAAVERALGDDEASAAAVNRAIALYEEKEATALVHLAEGEYSP